MNRSKTQTENFSEKSLFQESNTSNKKQGGVTLSGIYCQTATGAKRSPVPFIAVAPLRAVVVVSSRSAFGAELASLGSHRSK